MMSYEEMAIEYNRKLKTALELIMNELNHGQRKKIAKNAEVKALLERYGIETEDE